ncbi:phage minor head protein [Virgibacillus sp. W0430]|uniref:phage minor head protein n=1 Tax=Virgibacillus sp. W0430 TaxID=3391580 RepID=UPI003F45B4D2
MNKQQKQNKRALDRLEKKFERELIRNYQITLKELRSKIAFIYEKYDGNWIEMQRYNRLAKLEKEIAQEIGKLTGKNAMTLKKGMADVYEESFYRTAWVLSNEVKSDLGFSILDRKLVEKAIKNPLDRVGFLQRNRDNQARLTRQLREQLAQGLIQGEAYSATVKRIKRRMDVGATNVMRIAQTENHRVRQVGKLDSLEEGAEAGITLKKQWLATVDGSTRESHQDLDGVTIDIDADFEGEEGSGPAPGMLGSAEEDINCRCDMIEIVDGFEPNERRVRGVGITEYKTYNEFYESLK